MGLGVWNLNRGDLLNESALFNSQDADLDEQYGSVVDVTNSKRQLVISCPQAKMDISTQGGIITDNSAKFKIYAAPFNSDGTLKDWDKKATKDLGDQSKTMGLNYTDADFTITEKYCVLWKIVIEPYDPNAWWWPPDDTSYMEVDIRSAGLQPYSTFDYTADFKGKRLVVFHANGDNTYPYKLFANNDTRFNGKNANKPGDYLKIDGINPIGTQDYNYGIWFLP